MWRCFPTCLICLHRRLLKASQGRIDITEARPCSLQVQGSRKPFNPFAQIVVQNKSGFNIDPYHGNAAAELMADFFEESAKDPEHWNAISRGSLERIKAKCAPDRTRV